MQATEWWQQLVPELSDEVHQRLDLLHHIYAYGSIGRRALAELVGRSERTVRSEVTSLERQGLLTITAKGITLTEEGTAILLEGERYFRTHTPPGRLAKALTRRLGVDHVVVVRGDSTHSDTARQTLVQTAAFLVSDTLLDGQIVAVSGGSTMAAIADALPKKEVAITVVPARGGFGEQLETQANVIAARFAEKNHGQYRMLHVPDGFSSQVIALLRKEDQNTVAVERLIHQAQVLVVGIGVAQEMAQRRGLHANEVERITVQGAQGEILGHYVNQDGDVVYHRNNVGLQPDDLRKIPHVLMIAGGSHKAAAIAAVARRDRGGTLITDEGAARAILAQE